MLRFLDFLAELLLPVQQKLRDANRAEVALNLAKYIFTKIKRKRKLTKIKSKKKTKRGRVEKRVGWGEPIYAQVTELLLPVQQKLRDANRAEVALNLAKYIFIYLHLSKE